MTEGLVHVAGPVITVGTVRRQRCQWCGALIQEHDLARISRTLEPGEDPDNPGPWEPAHWEGLVLVDDHTGSTFYASVDEPEDGKVPPNSCMALPDEATT